MRLLPILLLSAAGFTVLTTEFIIVGLLPAIARDLEVSIPQAGLLVTLFAFTVAAFGPFLTAYFARFERRKLFISVLIMFGLANTLAALAPNIWVMAVARLIPALGLPVFWALASETAVDIVGPDYAGRAIAKIGFGIVCATVFGIPVGTLISDAFGWRSAFGILAVIAFAKALLLFIYLPKTSLHQHQVSFRSQFKILRSPVMVGHVLLSIIVFSGMFTAYTYLADILERLAGFDGTVVGWCLMGFGAVGLIGNSLGGACGGSASADRVDDVLRVHDCRAGGAGAEHPFACRSGGGDGYLGHHSGSTVSGQSCAFDESRARGASVCRLAEHRRGQPGDWPGRHDRRPGDRQRRPARPGVCGCRFYYGVDPVGACPDDFQTPRSLRLRLHSSVNNSRRAPSVMATMPGCLTLRSTEMA